MSKKSSSLRKAFLASTRAKELQKLDTDMHKGNGESSDAKQ